MEEIARGCGSTGWVTCAYLSTAWLVANFPEAAQREVYAETGYTIGPCPMNARLGTARKVDGGYQVSLTAPFGSGVFHSDWAVLCATTVPEEASNSVPTPIAMVIPRKDYQFNLQTWAVLGMRGTGSATIKVDNAFVPEHRAIDLNSLSAGTAPGTLINKAPTYRVPIISAFVLGGVGALLGLARRGQEALEEGLRSSVFGMTGQTRGHTPASQMALGEMASGIHAASALIASDLRHMTEATAQNVLTADDRAKFRLDAAYCAMLCRKSIAMAKDALGASCMRDGHPVQNVFRDLHMISGSAAFSVSRTQELYGQSRLGLLVDVDEV
jgi:alkylation response protein AidB-like acyl-CoA dehydrogenase